MLTPNHIYNSVISGWDVGVSAFKHRDTRETVIISTTHLNVPVATSNAYKVTRNIPGTPPTVEVVAQSEVAGKDNSASAIVFDNGDLWFIVAEAAPAQGGATSRIDIYEYIGAFSPVIPGLFAIDATARTTANAALALANKILSILKMFCNIS